MRNLMACHLDEHTSMELPAEIDAFRRSDPPRFFRTIQRELSVLTDGHWWCARPDLMFELLPCLTDLAQIHAELAEQLATCQACAEQYHSAIARFAATSHLRHRDVQQEIDALTAWNIERISNALSESVGILQHRFLRSGSGPAAPDLEKAEQRCDNVLHESLLDPCIVLDPRVAQAVNDVFKVYTPNHTHGYAQKSSENRVLPGVFTLYFHFASAVRGWARRAKVNRARVAQSVDDLPPSLLGLIDACILRLETPEGQAVVNLCDHGSMLDISKRDVLWEGLSVLMQSLGSRPVLEHIVNTHCSFLTTATYTLASESLMAVQYAAQILARMFHVLDYRIWLNNDDGFRPETVVSSAKLAYEDDSASDVVRRAILAMFRPLLCSVKALSAEDNFMLIAGIVDFLLDLALQKCPVVENLGLGKVSLGSWQRRQKDWESSMADVRATTANVLVECYSICPTIVRHLDSEHVGTLLEDMFVMGRETVAARQLLNTVLVTDARNTFCAATNSVLLSNVLPVVAEALNRHCAEQGYPGPSWDTNEDSDGLYGPAVIGNSLVWMEGVWTRLQKGKFRAAPFGDSRKVIAAECNILLAVHQLIGVLNISDDPVSTEEAKKRRHWVLTGAATALNDNELLEANVEVALSIMLEVIAAQFVRAKSQAPAAWLQYVPAACGHLFMSSSQDVRDGCRWTLEELCRQESGTLSLTSFLPPGKILKSEAHSDAVLKGSLAMVKFVTICGTRFAFRGFLAAFRWVQVVLNTRVDKVRLYLGLGAPELHEMALAFLNGWDAAQKYHSKLFSRVMVGCFEVLESTWGRFVAGNNGDRCPIAQERLLDALVKIGACSDVNVLQRWASVVATASSVYGYQRSHRNVIVGFISQWANGRQALMGSTCELLARVFDISAPSQDMQPTASREANAMQSKALAAALGERPSVKRAAPSKKPRQLHITMDKTNVPHSNTGSLNLPGQKKYSELSSSTHGLGVHPQKNDVGLHRSAASGSLQSGRGRLRVGFVGATRKRAAEVIARPVVKTHIQKGPTLMEQQVARFKLEKARKEKAREEASLYEEMNEDGREVKARASVANLTGDGSSSKQMEGFAHVRQTLVDTNHIAQPVQGAKALSIALQTGRFERMLKELRRVSPRSMNGLHAKILKWNIPSILEGSPLVTVPTKRSASFRTAEDYVKYWEVLLLEELRSQLQRCLEEERKCVAATRAARAANATTWPCCTPFEVAVAPEPQGACKMLLLRFKGPHKLRDTGCDKQDGDIAAWSDSFSAAGTRAGDFLILRIAQNTRLPMEADSSSNSTLDIIGYVSRLDYQRHDVLLSVKVVFSPHMRQPGPGRLVEVSRLMSNISQERQFESLWRICELPDNLMLSILCPDDSWLYERRMRKSERSSKPDPSLRCSPAQLSVLSELDRSGINVSQRRVISELAENIASVGARQLHLAWKSETDAPQNFNTGFTLLQGPPGTGKTSTILSVLSVLLAHGYPGLGPLMGSARKTRYRLSSGQEMLITVPKVRILVCAPSNTAVDEILMRVMEKGLVMPGGARGVPRIVRIGAGSKHDTVNAVNYKELIQRRSESEWNGAANAGSGSDGQIEERNKLRISLSKTSSAIGEADRTRKKLKADYDEQMEELKGCKGTEEDVTRAVQALSNSMRDKYSKLTVRLTALHEEKKKTGNALALKEKVVKGKEKERDARRQARLVSVLNSACIVFATLNSAGHDAMSNFAGTFDYAIIDECAQAIEPDILIPLVGSQARRAPLSTNCLLVGDPKQLPATVLSSSSAAVDCLNFSLFERLQAAKRSCVFLLRVQYRMHPEIARFSSSQFYEGRVRNGGNVKTRKYRKPYHFDPARRFGPLTFLDTSHCPSAHEERGAGTSLFNSFEADVISCFLNALVRLYPEYIGFSGDIAVLTPYLQQVSCIRQKLSSSVLLTKYAIESGTVDGMQGREKDIVILSAVRSSDKSHGIGFVKDPRRLNVALTRARSCVVVVGNGRLLAASSGHWRVLLNECRASGRAITLRPSHQLYPESDMRLQVQPVRFDESLVSLPEFSDSDQLDDALLTNMSSDSDDSGDALSKPAVHVKNGERQVHVETVFDIERGKVPSMAKLESQIQSIDNGDGEKSPVIGKPHVKRVMAGSVSCAMGKEATSKPEHLSMHSLQAGRDVRREQGPSSAEHDLTAVPTGFYPCVAARTTLVGDHGVLSSDTPICARKGKPKQSRQASRAGSGSVSIGEASHTPHGNRARDGLSGKLQLSRQMSAHHSGQSANPTAAVKRSASNCTEGFSGMSKRPRLHSTKPVPKNTVRHSSDIACRSIGKTTPEMCAGTIPTTRQRQPDSSLSGDNARLGALKTSLSAVWKNSANGMCYPTLPAPAGNSQNSKGQRRIIREPCEILPPPPSTNPSRPPSAPTAHSVRRQGKPTSQTRRPQSQQSARPAAGFSLISAVESLQKTNESINRARQ